MRHVIVWVWYVTKDVLILGNPVSIPALRQNYGSDSLTGCGSNGFEGVHLQRVGCSLASHHMSQLVITLFVSFMVLGTSPHSEIHGVWGCMWFPLFMCVLG